MTSTRKLSRAQEMALISVYDLNRQGGNWGELAPVCIKYEGSAGHMVIVQQLFTKWNECFCHVKPDIMSQLSSTYSLLVAKLVVLVLMQAFLMG